MQDSENGIKIYCTPTCNFLKCQQKALGRKFRKNNKIIIACNFVPGEICDGYKCKYSFCLKHKMAPNGKCLLNSAMPPKKIQEEDETREIEPKPKVNKSLKFKSKILKKIKDFDDL